MDLSILPAIDTNNIWFRHTDADAIIIFVHGVLSNSRTCWLYEDNKSLQKNSYWPDLIGSDPRFGNISIFLGGYDSNVDSGGYEIRSCVDELFGALKRIDRSGYSSPLKKQKITFVCHSMGGIVVRSMLERHPEAFATKDVGLVLIASPTFGSEFANSLDWLIRFFNNQQGVHLQLGDWSLADLDNRFRDLQNSKKIPKLRGVEFYENRFVVHAKWLPIAATTPVVNLQSQGRYFGAPKQIPKSDHFSICKPKSDTHTVHQYLYDFLQESDLLPQKGRLTIEAGKTLSKVDPRFAGFSFAVSGEFEPSPQGTDIPLVISMSFDGRGWPVFNNLTVGLREVDIQLFHERGAQSIEASDLSCRKGTGANFQGKVEGHSPYWIVRVAGSKDDWLTGTRRPNKGEDCICRGFQAGDEMVVRMTARINDCVVRVDGEPFGNVSDAKRQFIEHLLKLATLNGAEVTLGEQFLTVVEKS